MRTIMTAAGAAMLFFVMLLQSAEADLIGRPLHLRSSIQHIKFDTPMLSPMAYTQFCVRYPNECRLNKTFRGGPLKMTPTRWADLTRINNTINRNILPERNERGLAGESWLINPDKGDCNDYAVTKRHELLRLGWPRRSLLLSEVIIPSGEHHLVVIVRTKGGDLVLDNMTPQVKLWSALPYRWIRIQKPDDAQLWASMSQRKA